MCAQLTARMIIVRYVSTYFLKVLFSSSSQQQFSAKLRSQPIAELENEITIKKYTLNLLPAFLFCGGLGRGGFQ